MPESITPRRRVEIVLDGGVADCVPFTIYEVFAHRCQAEREMRNSGMCVIDRDVNVFSAFTPNCTVRQEVYWQDGRRFTRTHYSTPVGSFSTLDEAGGFTDWAHEKMFKSVADYKPILFYLKDHRFQANYEAFARRQEELGGDVLLRAQLGLEPLQQLISGPVMTVEDYCQQWMENRDEVLRLYEAMVENRRKIYPLVAGSPAGHANYGGNVVGQIIGPTVFEKYYLPHYQEAAEILHRHGKLIGCHFDDDCRQLADMIGRSGLDYIEAFTPAPDTDMTVAEARRAWPEKILWLNFPSTVHLKSDEEIERTAWELVEQNGSAEGLIVGITEDMPEGRWTGSCPAIMRGLQRHARQKRQWYKSVAM